MVFVVVDERRRRAIPGIRSSPPRGVPAEIRFQVRMGDGGGGSCKGVDDDDDDDDDDDGVEPPTRGRVRRGR